MEIIAQTTGDMRLSIDSIALYSWGARDSNTLTIRSARLRAFADNGTFFLWEKGDASSEPFLLDLDSFESICLYKQLGHLSVININFPYPTHQNVSKLARREVKYSRVLVPWDAAFSREANLSNDEAMELLMVHDNSRVLPDVQSELNLSSWIFVG
ncbi:hypothetical protein PYCCODRAFT_1472555 [Trametes coccinea BRFM310]|uniref:Uncharacterized protein n=1 Tax=Trametes coccinea (strain BRFM310) TaxID=1353009 RepID=A0A1Y2I5V6_TRAC3|nr:hypothetical protein PYCCODRAFT_1472555 [Trametes coccinea BRFM310]